MRLDIDTASGDQLAALTKEQFDDLPFGAIRLDATGRIVAYNATEGVIARRTPSEVIGRNFFTEVAPCTNTPSFRGVLDTLGPDRPSKSIDYVFRFPWGERKVRVRFMVSADETRWVFVTTR